MGKHCIFILHGSRSHEVLSATNRLNEQLLKKLKTSFSICYLTHNTPSLSEALEKAFSNGASEIICFPLFVLPGQHIREDIPNIIDDFKRNHTDLEIKLLPSLVETQYFTDFLVKSIEADDE